MCTGEETPRLPAHKVRIYMYGHKQTPQQQYNTHTPATTTHNKSARIIIISVLLLLRFLLCHTYDDSMYFDDPVSESNKIIKK